MKGGGIGDGCFAHIVPGDELPAPGDAYDCGCNRLMWCPAMAACIFTSQYTPERCEGIL
ncbi:hypothetical protein OH806_11685 [Chryseobacterium sp. WLa1L2M3]|uniref:Uncharacterized protein n=1 Tax=Chryseobacterium oryctis TaxID=2952618 RepID=A0ABT3HQ65_9FLAO|nr:hypothetical protein [Chryseobacterium oryctis]MCW3161926.1 hypothetical protein [Chryseobacterium oryctis]